MDGKEKKWLKVYFLVVVPILLVLGGAIIWFFKIVWDTSGCIHVLEKSVYPAVLDGDKLKQDRDLVKFIEARWKENMYEDGIPVRALCPVCKEIYIYQPFEGKLDKQARDARLIAWCPEPCHWGGRVVLTEAWAWWLPEEEFKKAQLTGKVNVEHTRGINSDFPPFNILLVLILVWVLVFVAATVFLILLLIVHFVFKSLRKNR